MHVKCHRCDKNIILSDGFHCWCKLHSYLKLTHILQCHLHLWSGWHLVSHLQTKNTHSWARNTSKRTLKSKWIYWVNSLLFTFARVAEEEVSFWGCREMEVASPTVFWASGGLITTKKIKKKNWMGRSVSDKKSSCCHGQQHFYFILLVIFMTQKLRNLQILCSQIGWQVIL